MKRKQGTILGQAFEQIALVCLLAVVVSNVHGYPVETHSRITEHAAVESELHQGWAQSHLWLGEGLNDRWFRLRQRVYPDDPVYGYDQLWTPMGLLKAGSRREDELPRPRNHFFDPQNNGRGLTIGSFEVGHPSPIWALGLEGFNQSRSYVNAKGHYSLALSLPTKDQRDRALAEMFQTLGHVMHHIQDMAQPQHTRNDSHVLPSSAAYEAYVRRRWAEVPIAGYTVDHSEFSKPLEFWTSGGRGIAEFSSFNFVSRGTNFLGNLEAIDTNAEYEMPGPYGVPSSVTDITELLGHWDPVSQPLEGEIWFVQTEVNDVLIGAASINERASSFSIFENELRREGKSLSFSMNRFNYQAAAEYLVPRAVAYSAALLDHFFRGQLEVAAPRGGVYAVLDHATTNSPGSGYTQLTARVRNVSSDPAAEGHLRAVVKYFRNPCYEPSLAGEWREGGFEFETWNQCEEFYADVVDDGHEGMSVSDLIPVASIPDSFTEFDFVFGIPIPVDAYDLRMQIVFEGHLGEEADGIALGAVNISEPTFFGIMNATDYFGIDGVFYSPAEIEASPELLERVDGYDYHARPFHFVEYRVGEELIAGPGTLEAGSFHRIAVLSDDGVIISVGVSAYAEGHNIIETVMQFPAARNQFERDPVFGDVAYTSDTRGAIAHFIRGYFKSIGPEPSRETFLALPPIQEGCYPEDGCGAMPTAIDIP